MTIPAEMFYAAVAFIALSLFLSLVGIWIGLNKDSDAENRDRRLSKLEEEASFLRARIDQLEREGHAKDERIARLETEGIAKDARIAKLETELANKQRQIAELQRQINRPGTIQ